MNEAKPLLELSTNTPDAAKFFVERFNRVGSSNIEGIYTKLLQTLFPDEWEKIVAKAKPETDTAG